MKRGIRFGSAKTLTATGFIPDPSDGAGATTAAEGVAVDSERRDLRRGSRSARAEAVCQAVGGMCDVALT